jgi:hypothetical protein
LESIPTNVFLRHLIRPFIDEGIDTGEGIVFIETNNGGPYKSVFGSRERIASIVIGSGDVFVLGRPSVEVLGAIVGAEYVCEQLHVNERRMGNEIFR